eukprot:403339949
MQTSHQPGSPTNANTHGSHSAQQYKKPTTYQYMSIKDIAQDQNAQTDTQFYFFGVVIDAAYPYKNQNGRFLCSVKVVDHSFHHKDKGGESSNQSPQHATVIFYAKRFEDLPIIKRIGDVIRVHRATKREYQGQLQFHVNVFFNSSWCLFEQQSSGALNDQENQISDNDSDDNGNGNEDQEMLDEEQRRERQQERIEKRKYKPYKFSGKSYTFDVSHEKVQIDSLRNWGEEYFKNNYVITKEMYKLLKDVKQDITSDQNKEFDLICKILKIFEKDETSLEIRIKDLSQEMWFMNVPRFKFQNLKQGEVIRIRCVEVNLTSKRNVIQTKQYTNILRFNPQARIAKELTKKIENETDMDKVLGDEAGDIVMNAVILTEITDAQLSRTQCFKISDLFIDYEKIPEDLREKNAFRVRFYCLRIDPQDHREIVQAYCPSCHETFSCKELDKEGRSKCISCKVECKLIYKMQMLVKDSSSQMNKNFYRILLCSFEEGKGHDFFTNVKPCNLYQNPQALELIERQLKAMTKFNVWIDAIIERQGSYFLIRDTKISQMIN